MSRERKVTSVRVSALRATPGAPPLTFRALPAPTQGCHGFWETSWNQRRAQAAHRPSAKQVGTEGVQEGALGHTVLVQPLRWFLTLQGHRA